MNVRSMFLRWIGIAAVVAFAATAHAAEPYPTRPVRIIVPLGAGSATDVLARVLAESLRKELPGAWVVENRAGAGGILGAQYVAKAQPDGYVLGLFHSSVLTVAAATIPNLAYDPRKDFTYIGTVATNPIVLVVPANSRFKTLADYIAAAKESGKVTCGIIGTGSHSQFNLEILKIAAGADVTVVSYAGGTSPVLSSLLGGEIDSASLLWAAVAELLRADKIRVLATSARLDEFPAVPTFASQGYPQANLEVRSILVGPAHMPPEITQRLVPVLAQLANDDTVHKTIEQLGNGALYLPPAETLAHVATEITNLTAVAQKVGIKSE